MKQQALSLDGIPALLWGEPSTKVLLAIHGQGGNKEEASLISSIACPKGWQVLSIDLPEHGGRQQPPAFLPWHCVSEIRRAAEYAQAHWDTLSLSATSIGAWLSLLALQDIPFAQCFFVSPVLDMEALILSMMDAAQVTEERLQTEKEIATAQGVLSWEYLQYVRAHTVKSWPHATHILYAEKDHMVPRASIDAFAARHHCSLTCMPGGEHWFHTPEQLKFLSDWYRENLEE